MINMNPEYLMTDDNTDLGAAEKDTVIFSFLKQYTAYIVLIITVTDRDEIAKLSDKNRRKLTIW